MEIIYVCKACNRSLELGAVKPINTGMLVEVVTCPNCNRYGREKMARFSKTVKWLKNRLAAAEEDDKCLVDAKLGIHTTRDIIEVFENILKGE